MIYLLDTCVISEAIKQTPNARVEQWVKGLAPQQQRYSPISLGEIENGIRRMPGGKKRNLLEKWFEGEFLPSVAGRLLNIDLSIAHRWGQLMAWARSNGRPLPVLDAYIAATALHFEFPVVTRNETDFKACGVKVVNPWK